MKPIIFSTPMVRAILDGRKTQTRRVIKPNIIEKGTNWFWNPNENVNLAPYKPGDVLWVRETWATVSSGIIEYRAKYKEPYTGSTEIDHIGKKITWRPSIHMPREAARIFLKVTNVRVERVQDITEEDARSEGVKDPYEYQSPEYYEQPSLRGFEINKSAFAGCWDSIYSKRGYGWDTNPWVWVVKFERISKDEALLKESEVEENE